MQEGTRVSDRSRFFAFALLLVCSVALPLAAQPLGTSQPGEIRSDVRLQVFRFGNFFWASSPADERNETALGAEFRTAWRFSQAPTQVYAHANYLDYRDGALRNGYGARIGASQDGARNDFDVYADYAANRPSVALRDVFTTADITTLYGTYAFQLTPSWQIGAVGSHDRQKVKNLPTRDNHFTGGGPLIRYNGFGWRITPMVGYTSGKRSVNNSSDSYRERAWTAGVEWIPTDPLYFSAALHRIRRTFETNDFVSPNFGRRENDPQVELVAAYRVRPRLQLIAYFSRDAVDVPISGESFQARVLLLSAAWQLPALRR